MDENKELPDELRVQITFGHGARHLTTGYYRRAMAPPRPLTLEEVRLAAFLLSGDVSDAELLRRQLSGVSVWAECTGGCGTIDIAVAGAPSAPSLVGGPVVTAHGADSDGMFIEVNLYRRERFISELEIWRGDGAPLLRYPEPANLTVA